MHMIYSWELSELDSPGRTQDFLGEAEGGSEQLFSTEWFYQKNFFRKYQKNFVRKELGFFVTGSPSPMKVAIGPMKTFKE